MGNTTATMKGAQAFNNAKQSIGKTFESERSEPIENPETRREKKQRHRQRDAE